MKFPDEPTTAQQWTVIAWTIVAIFGAAGIAAFYFSARAAALGKPEIATELRNIGFALTGLAIFAWAVRRFILWILS